jgi:hypothetical protein
LKGAKPDEGEQPDGDVRELAFKKTQYGPTGETIVLRYQRGLFLPERGVSNLDKLAREAVDDIFLHGLGQIIQQGRNAIAGENTRIWPNADRRHGISEDRTYWQKGTGCRNDSAA